MSASDHILAEYLRRSYHAVDGLWFVMLEDEAGFDLALELDRRVWEIMPKLQARKARELLGCSGNTLADLTRCFTLKLQGDGHIFETHLGENCVTFAISRCPWLELMRKSGRADRAAAISTVICPTEGQGWCHEFGDEFSFELAECACKGEEKCVMKFHRQ